jgi:hypothetical protein
MNRTQITLPGQELAPPQPQTWTADIGVPLTQNLLGGVAVAGLVGVVWRAVGELPADWWIPAVLAGSAVACIATITRYFGDDVGIVTAAYNAGRRSRDAEVNHLILQLQIQHDAAIDTLGGVSATEAAQYIAKANATLADARKLLRVIYEHGPHYATREKMATLHMTQRPWERARSLCIAADAIDQDMRPTAPDYAAAMKRVEERHKIAVSDMRKNPRSRVAWAV